MGKGKSSGFSDRVCQAIRFTLSVVPDEEGGVTNELDGFIIVFKTTR